MISAQPRTSLWTSLLGALFAVLFVFSAIARIEHIHHHDCAAAAAKCSACVAHASSATAMLDASPTIPVNWTAAAGAVIVPSIPVHARETLTLACRGPPSCS